MLRSQVPKDVRIHFQGKQLHHFLVLPPYLIGVYPLGANSLLQEKTHLFKGFCSQGRQTGRDKSCPPLHTW